MLGAAVVRGGADAVADVVVDVVLDVVLAAAAAVVAARVAGLLVTAGWEAAEWVGLVVGDAATDGAAVEFLAAGTKAGRAVGAAGATGRAASAARCEASDRVMPTATTAHPATASEAVTEATARPNVMGPL